MNSTARSKGRVCIAVSKEVHELIAKASEYIGCPEGKEVTIKFTTEELIKYALSKLPACG